MESLRCWGTPTLVERCVEFLVKTLYEGNDGLSQPIFARLKKILPWELYTRTIRLCRASLNVPEVGSLKEDE
jgi:hypothetical protein